MKKNVNTSVLDTMPKNNHAFLQEWTPSQFKAIEKAISRHFSFKQIRTLHGNYPAFYMGFKALEEIMGLAYTSSSSYAGYWICNTEVYNEKYPGYYYIGFAISTKGKYYAILWDKDENEIIIPL